MSYLSYDFPHTRNQDSDLRQIIEIYKTLRALPEEWEKYKQSINGTINSDVIAYLESNLDNILNTFGRERKIVYIGDSYCQGTGGHGEDIQKAVQKLLGGQFRSFYAGGAGFIRPNASNETFLTCVNRAIDNIDNKLEITDFVFIGGYNELGVVPRPTTEEFTIAMKSCFDLIRENFPLAAIHLVAMPWINITYNWSYTLIQQRMIEAGIANGVHTARYALNWLLGLASDVQSGDNIHPSATGYAIIANYVSILLAGDNPSASTSFISNDLHINNRRVEVTAFSCNDRMKFDIVIYQGEEDIPVGTQLFSLLRQSVAGSCNLLGTSSANTVEPVVTSFNGKDFVAGIRLLADRYYRIDTII